MSGFELHPEAYGDLDEIWEFIAHDSLDAADRVREEIYTLIQTLVSFPHQGHRRTDLTNRPLLFVRCYDYLVAYAPNEKPLWVIAVLHGKRKPSLMAAILRGRAYQPIGQPAAP